MSRRLVQLHAGIAGLALLRLYPKGPVEVVDHVLRGLRAHLDGDTEDPADPLLEMTVEDGYRAWASSYDEGFNPVIAMEEPVLARH